MNFNVRNERETAEMGISVLNSAMKNLFEYVEPEPYKAEIVTYFGVVGALLFKLKCDMPKMDFMNSFDDNCPINAYDAPPFITVEMGAGMVQTIIGNNPEQRSINSSVLTFDETIYNAFIKQTQPPSAKKEEPTDESIYGNGGSYATPKKVERPEEVMPEFNQKLEGKYVMYYPVAKHESLINLMTLLLVAGYPVNDTLKMVIYDGINRLFGVNIESVELAGVDETVEKCMDILNISDDRLVSRHILLAGKPGCGKSETVKKLVLLTPDWIHYPLNTRIVDWGTFMNSLNKLMKFLDRTVMIIVDEIDEIGLSRDKDHNVVYDLLRVMDGINDIGRIKFVATTNRPGDIDEALKRPGRFYPLFEVAEPNDETATKIVEFYVERYKKESKGKVDVAKIVKGRDGAVGCDIRAAFEDCIIHREPINTKNIMKYLTAVMSSKKMENKNFN